MAKSHKPLAGFDKLIYFTRSKPMVSKTDGLAQCVALLFSLTLSGCFSSSSSSSALVTECVLNNDQAGTISGAWPGTPIPVAFQQGAFSASEKADIVAAANTWNDFYSASKGFNLIVYGNDTAPDESTEPSSSFQNNLCSDGIIQNGTFKNGRKIVIFKLGTWSAAYPKNAIALTNFCTQAGSPYAKIFNAVMLLNYKTFFVEGAKLPDLRSVVLHEFGHLIGLNHSCEGTSKNGFPNCNDSGINPEYLSALMFPSFGFDETGIGEQRRVLNANDQGRANCIYPKK